MLTKLTEYIETPAATLTLQSNGTTVGTYCASSSDTTLNVETMVSLTQAQYDALPSTKTSDGKTYYITDGTTVERNVITLTQAQYDALPSSKLTDNNVYCISDTGMLGDASLIDYDNTESGLTADTVQEAIDEIAPLGGRVDISHITTTDVKAVVENVISSLSDKPLGVYTCCMSWNSHSYGFTSTVAKNAYSTSSTEIRYGGTIYAFDGNAYLFCAFVSSSETIIKVSSSVTMSAV